MYPITMIEERLVVKLKLVFIVEFAERLNNNALFLLKSSSHACPDDYMCFSMLCYIVVTPVRDDE